MHLRSIRRRYTCYGLLLALSILCTVWLDSRQIGSSILWSLVIVFLVGLFIRQSQKLQTAKLIWDNRILVIPGAFLTKCSNQCSGRGGVVNFWYTDWAIYEWGRRGLWGTRLQTMDVDQKKMRLSFGNERQTMWFEFEHGIETKQKILEVVQTLWRETGVEATIQG